MIGVSGVSGSGKSSLVNETLTPAILRQLRLSAKKPGPFSRLTGVEQIDKLIEIDQSPLGRSPDRPRGRFGALRGSNGHNLQNPLSAVAGLT